MKRKTLYVIAFVAILFNTILGLFLIQYHYESTYEKAGRWYTAIHYPFTSHGMLLILASMIATLLITAVTLAFYHTHKDERASFWKD